MDVDYYRCPVCHHISDMVISESQAFCTNEVDCLVISWNPSIPFQEQAITVLDFP